MKLELKHLKNYLGTGLKCQYIGVINGKELSAEDKRLSGLDVFDPKYKCEVSPEYALKIGELKEIKVYKNYWTAHIGIHRRGLKTFCNGHDFKPILLPLSALTEPLEDGSIPIVELAKMAEMIEPISFDKMEDHVRLQRGVVAKDRFNNQWLMFDFKHGFSMWHKPHGELNHRPTLCENQLQLFEYLFEHHFDIYGLIDAGLAIDKRTIK